MKEELFDVPVTKSPKLRWMERYKVKTSRADHEVTADEEDDFGHPVFQWTASNGSLTRGGDTEEDALAAWARSREVRLWNEE